MGHTSGNEASHLKHINKNAIRAISEPPSPTTPFPLGSTLFVSVDPFLLGRTGDRSVHSIGHPHGAVLPGSAPVRSGQVRWSGQVTASPPAGQPPCPPTAQRTSAAPPADSHRSEVPPSERPPIGDTRAIYSQRRELTPAERAQAAPAGRSGEPSKRPEARRLRPPRKTAIIICSLVWY